MRSVPVESIPGTMRNSRLPLNEVTRIKRVRWYRSPIEPQALRRLMQRSDLQGWLQAGGNLALFAATATLTWYLFLQQAWVGFALALYLHCTFGSFLSAACHELDHGTVFKTKPLNRVFLRIYAPLAWFNFHDYALSHTYHHRYTLHPDGDREVVLPQSPTLRWLYVLQLLTINITGGPMCRGLWPILRYTVTAALGLPMRADTVGDTEPVGVRAQEWIVALYEAHPEERRKSIRWAQILLLLHGSVLVVAIALQLWLLPVLISLPVAVANWWRYLVFMPMHCGLRDNIADFRKCVRSIRIDPLSSFLYWRMNWHMEHHMYAGVPCYHLRKLSRAIAADCPPPRTLIGAWREMRAAWLRQRVEPDFQYDTPVPTEAQARAATDARNDDALGGSIGDLAPAVLER